LINLNKTRPLTAEGRLHAKRIYRWSLRKFRSGSDWLYSISVANKFQLP